MAIGIWQVLQILPLARTLLGITEPVQDKLVQLAGGTRPLIGDSTDLRDQIPFGML